MRESRSGEERKLRAETSCSRRSIGKVVGDTMRKNKEGACGEAMGNLDGGRIWLMPIRLMS